MVTSDQCTTRKAGGQTNHKAPKHLLGSWRINMCLEVTTWCCIDVQLVQLTPKVIYVRYHECCDFIKDCRVAKLK